MLAVPSTKAAFVFILPPRGCRTLAYLHILFPKSTSTKVLVRNTELTGEMKRIFYHMWYSNNPHFTIWLFDIFSTKFLLSGGTSRIFVCVSLLLPQGKTAFLDLLVPTPTPGSLHSFLSYIEQFGFAPASVYKCTFPTPSKDSTKQSVSLFLDSILAYCHHF